MNKRIIIIVILIVISTIISFTTILFVQDKKIEKEKSNANNVIINGQEVNLENTEKEWLINLSDEAFEIFNKLYADDFKFPFDEDNNFIISFNEIKENYDNVNLYSFSNGIISCDFDKTFLIAYKDIDGYTNRAINLDCRADEDNIDKIKKPAAIKGSSSGKTNSNQKTK